MNSATVANRLRDQIARFSGILSEGLPKKARKFVREMVYGIQARESVRLTEIGSFDEASGKGDGDRR